MINYKSARKGMACFSHLAKGAFTDTRHAARDKNFSHLVCFILLFTDHAKTCEIILPLLTS